MMSKLEMRSILAVQRIVPVTMVNQFAPVSLLSKAVNNALREPDTKGRAWQSLSKDQSFVPEKRKLPMASQIPNFYLVPPEVTNSPFSRVAQRVRGASSAVLPEMGTLQYAKNPLSLSSSEKNDNKHGDENASLSVESLPGIVHTSVLTMTSFPTTSRERNQPLLAEVCKGGDRLSTASVSSTFSFQNMSAYLVSLKNVTFSSFNLASYYVMSLYTLTNPAIFDA
ncbi:MAG: hypothetical protein IJU37_04265 [Desulfovibrio sp.]|nr:hypothetical protein [Desulfovibrio sp.]